jgi:ankyrin repeat protein
MKKYLEYITFRSIPQSGYIKENQSLEEQWFDAIFSNRGLEKVKEFINQGIDVNLINRYNKTALILSSVYEIVEIVKLLLEQPNIDVIYKDGNDLIFINYLEDKSFLKDYKLQKKILENGRVDIILFFDKYGLVNDKIKEENPDLINASNWGLIY